MAKNESYKTRQYKDKVLKRISEIGLSQTIKEFEGLIGSSTIRRWNDPEKMERDRLLAYNRYQRKKDDPEFKKRNRESFQKYVSSEQGQNVFNNYQKQYQIDNRELLIEKKRNYYKNNKEACNSRCKEYNLRNFEKMSLAKKKYAKTYKERRNQLEREKYSNSMLHRLKHLLRTDLSNIIRNSVSKYENSLNAMDVLGCSIEQFKEHLSKQFKNGMCWENYGRWHIDHIIPVSSVKDENDVEQIRKVFHYSNMQPLWAIENLIKYNRNCYDMSNDIQYPNSLNSKGSLIFVESDDFSNIENYSNEQKSYYKTVLNYFNTVFDNVKFFERSDYENFIERYSSCFCEYYTIDVYGSKELYTKNVSKYESKFPHMRFFDISEIDFSNFLDLDYSYSEEQMCREFELLCSKKGSFDSIPVYNKIVLTNQIHFYDKERKLLQNPEVFEKLVKNRVKYKGKTVNELSSKELLIGLKISRIYKGGYSHFSPLWFKAFIEKYDIKTVYDPCGGWGHRLLGGLQLERYIYNDISKKTFNGVKNIVEKFQISNAVIYNNDCSTFTPTEDYEAVFTCPPYFNLEVYESGIFPSEGSYMIWWENTIKSCLKSNLKYFSFVINHTYIKMLKSIIEEKFQILKHVEDIQVGKNSRSHFERARNSETSNREEFLVIYSLDDRGTL